LRIVKVFIQETIGSKIARAIRKVISVGAGQSTETTLMTFLMTQAIFEPTLSCINTLKILKTSYSSYLPAYEDGTVCSETSAYKIQTPGNYPEENIQLANNRLHTSDRGWMRYFCKLQNGK
jgi:hypothetical protein